MAKRQLKLWVGLAFYVLFLAGFIMAGMLFCSKKDFSTGDDKLDSFLNQLQQMAFSGDNKTGLVYPKDENIVFYTANFSSTDAVPTPKTEKHNVLWVGNVGLVSVEALKNFQTILAATPHRQNGLKDIGIKSFYFPPTAIHPLPLAKKPRYIAIIGKLPLVEDILDKKNIAYRRYQNLDDKKIFEDLPQIKALIWENNPTEYKPELFLTAAAMKIPLLAPWVFIKENAINLFNDNVSFYNTKQSAEILIDELIAQSAPLKKRVTKAQNLVFESYSHQKAFNRLKAALSASNDDLDAPLSDSITLDVSAHLGNIGSGDYWITHDLADYLEKNGYQVNFSYFNSYSRPISETNIIVRGFLGLTDDVLTGKINILYLMYARFNDDNWHEQVDSYSQYMQKITDDAKKVDAVVVASKKLYDDLKKLGVNVFYVPQFTNPKRFYADYDKSLKSNLFFVGGNFFYRTAVYILNEYGFKVKVFGPGWAKGVAEADFLDNRVLNKYYSSAKIVLNDTREGMKKFGFISNRIFDATVVGTLVISDYMEEIEQIYGDTVPMYKNKFELIKLVRYYLNHEDERKEKAAKARDITLKYFSAQQAGKAFTEIIKQIKDDKGI